MNCAPGAVDRACRVSVRCPPGRFSALRRNGLHHVSLISDRTLEVTLRAVAQARVRMIEILKISTKAVSTKRIWDCLMRLLERFWS